MHLFLGHLTLQYTKLSIDWCAFLTVTLATSLRLDEHASIMRGSRLLFESNVVSVYCRI